MLMLMQQHLPKPRLQPTIHHGPTPLFLIEPPVDARHPHQLQVFQVPDAEPLRHEHVHDHRRRVGVVRPRRLVAAELDLEVREVLL